MRQSESWCFESATFCMGIRWQTGAKDRYCRGKENTESAKPSQYLFPSCVSGFSVPSVSSESSVFDFLCSRFSFFGRGAVLEFFRSRSLKARLPMRGTSGSVRRSPATPARPGREQRYRDRFVRRGVPEVPLICARRFSLWFSVSLCVLCVELFGFQHRGHREHREEKPGRDHGLTA